MLYDDYDGDDDDSWIIVYNSIKSSLYRYVNLSMTIFMHVCVLQTTVDYEKIKYLTVAYHLIRYSSRTFL
jgi:hypothetical protein